MIIELHFHDRNRPTEFWEIARTELTAPTVLVNKEGKFFVKCPMDPRIEVGGIKQYLLYKQCRGGHLSSIEIVRSPSEQEEVA